MGTADSYDLVIIGAGPGGYVAAIRAAQLGLSCAVVDRRESPGGTCLNIGCIPSKALLDSSELYARLAGEGLAAHGILLRESGPQLDLAAMMRRKDKVVQRLTSGVRQLLGGNGVRLVHGTARLRAADRVEVQGADGTTGTLHARRVLLATGSEPVSLPSLPVDGKRIITSTEALSLPQVPERLVVVGGGAIGLELGSIWARLGARVTVVELMEQILPGMDAELARTLRRSLEKQGLEIRTAARVSGYEGKRSRGRGARESLQLRVQPAASGVQPEGGAAGALQAGEELLDADLVLVAVGRRPCTEGLGLEQLGVRQDPRSGRLGVDEAFQTSVAGVYAIGDLIRGPMLAHKAEEEGMAVAELLAGRHGEVNYACIPAVVYTWPEVASVGKSEEQLKAQGVSYRKGSFPFRANGRALAMDSEEGLVKVLADGGTDAVLGVHIVGPWASDLIAEAVTVMEFGGSAEDIARSVHAHPTLPEAVREAALDVAGRAIHSRPKKPGT